MRTHFSDTRYDSVRKDYIFDKAEYIQRDVDLSLVNHFHKTVKKKFRESYIHDQRKAVWNNEQVQIKNLNTKKIEINSYFNIELNDVNFFLENAILKSKYILELKDDWDDEGSVGYTIDSLISAIDFVLKFNNWIVSISRGTLYTPKFHHGPKGTIDIEWSENNFRLFVNIDKINNKGTFYSDTSFMQSTEGEFKLDKISYNLLPIPLKP